MILDAFQVAAQPVAIAIALPWRPTIAIDALYKDQPVRIGRKNRIACTLRCRLPVDTRLPATPASRRGWFVMQIGSNDQRIVFIMLRQHHPVGEPARLW